MTPAFHPEGTADPQRVRWVVPAGSVPVGAVASAPAPLQRLVEDGTVARIEVLVDAVEITLADGRDWRSDGPAVRTALDAALRVPTEWAVHAPTSHLSASLAAVIAGRAGDYVRGHGGRVRVQRVEGEDAWLVMDGSCKHCPALVFTLQGTIERELKRLHPGPFRLHVSHRG